MKPDLIAFTAASVLALSACGSASAGSPGGSPSPTLLGGPLVGAVVDCLLDPTYGKLGDGNKTLTLDSRGDEDSDGLSSENILCALKHLKVTDAALAHIQDTRALDGSQTDTWPGITARWTYHPNTGLEMILQVAGA